MIIIFWLLLPSLKDWEMYLAWEPKKLKGLSENNIDHLKTLIMSIASWMCAINVLGERIQPCLTPFLM